MLRRPCLVKGRPAAEGAGPEHVERARKPHHRYAAPHDTLRSTGMTAVIDFLNDIFWGYVLIYGLLAVGVFFTWRLGFLQFRHFSEILRSIAHSREHDAGGITPFQALCTSLASRVGTGNLAGVAVAISLGGPGAIFWMWVVALLGMATAYAESTLAQLYKVRGHSEHGLYRGGPAFYIARGLKMRWLAVLFSLCLILA